MDSATINTWLPSVNTSMFLYEGALGSIMGTLVLDTFFSQEPKAKWALLTLISFLTSTLSISM